MNTLAYWADLYESALFFAEGRGPGSEYPARQAGSSHPHAHEDRHSGCVAPSALFLTPAQSGRMAGDPPVGLSGLTALKYVSVIANSSTKFAANHKDVKTRQVVFPLGLAVT